MPSWDPDIYARYAVYRDRPALDLLLQVPDDLAPRQIWDLGCGTGEHAALLAARHPAAVVHGLDSSAAMLAKARQRPGMVDWIQGDIGDFAPAALADLIFSNAALQWLDDHATLFRRLACALAPGGVLASQMPLSFDQPWHVEMRALAGEDPWRDRLAGLAGVRALASPGEYFEWLSAVCGQVDIWSTTYVHVLEGDDPVVDWMRGTGLRPYLDALSDPEEREAFLGAYRTRLASLLPARPDGRTLFPFPRLFIVARR